MLKSSQQGISVIITSHNTGSMLHEAVDSVLKATTGLVAQIVIVDDGSDNLETLSILDTLEENSNLEIVRLSKNSGAQNARTIGLSRARNFGVLVMDGDDILGEQTDGNNYIRDSLEVLHQKSDVAFTHCQCLMFGNFNGLTISPYQLQENLVMRKHHVPIYMIYRSSDAENLYRSEIEKWQDWSAGVGLLNNRGIAGSKNHTFFFNHPHYLYRIHKSTSRISARILDEAEMVKRTIRLYPEIFEKYYTDPSIHGLAEKIISYKPDRLTDLLYSAHLNSLEIAMQIVRERSWELSSSHYSIMDILSLAKNKDIDEVLELVRAEKLQLVERPNPENIP